MKAHRRTTRSASVLLAVALAALLGGCGSNSNASPQTTQGSTSQPTSGASRTTSASPTKVLTFIEENHSLDEMQAGMPYLSGLAHEFAYATDYSAITHPSLPNYLAIAGGSTFGVTDDSGPTVNGPRVGGAPSVFDQALASGHTAKTYAESMSGNCAASSGLYAARHNPWVYFSAGLDNCNTSDVPIGDPAGGALATDIAQGTLPNVGLVIPNLCNDAHDCSLATADHWLEGWLPQILQSQDFTSGRLVVVVTADEGNRTDAGNTVLTVVLSANGPHGQVVASPLTHYSLSGLYSHIIGAPALADAATAPSMAQAFGL